MARDPEKTANFAAGLITKLLAPLAVPIREFHRTVGHSFVSGMALLGAIAGGVAVYGLHLQEERLAPLLEAQIRSYEENTEASRLRNIRYVEEMSTTPPARTELWRLVAVNADTPTRSFSIQFPAVENAEQLVVSWRISTTVIPPNHDKEGLIIESIPTGNPVTVTIPWPDLWQPRDGISLTFEQVTSDGRRIRCTQSRMLRLGE